MSAEGVVRELAIDVSNSEVYISLLEDKNLVELNKESLNTKYSVGDIYLGKVKKLMPGLNAAFIDVGYEKDAFLHYYDLGSHFRTLDKFVKLANLPKQKSPNISYIKPENDIEKEGNISDVLKAGQLVLVQISKEPISSKGPRLSAEISIAGRNIVLIPFYNKISISQKIKNIEEKNRLKTLLKSIVPKGFGVIVRTVAENQKLSDIDNELKKLLNTWQTLTKNIKNQTPPKLVLGELNRTSAILRDILNKSFHKVHVNDEGLYNEIKEYVKEIAPEKEKIVNLYKKSQPIFEHFGVEKQIKSLFGKTVGMKAGSYLVIEHTEAFHVVDVNSGNRSKKDNDQETNAFEVNLTALEEVARQLKLRDMGGIIVIDLIDVHKAENKAALLKKMKELMSTDRAKHQILPLSKFCLMQITRQRVRPEMNITNLETCPICKGTGQITPSIVLSEEIENNLEYILLEKHVKGSVTIHVHPYLEAYFKRGIFSIYIKWLLKYKRFIKIKSSVSNDLLNYKIVNNKGVDLKN